MTLTTSDAKTLRSLLKALNVKNIRVRTGKGSIARGAVIVDYKIERTREDRIDLVAALRALNAVCHMGPLGRQDLKDGLNAIHIDAFYVRSFDNILEA